MKIDYSMYSISLLVFKNRMIKTGYIERNRFPKLHKIEPVIQFDVFKYEHKYEFLSSTLLNMNINISFSVRRQDCVVCKYKKSIVEEFNQYYYEYYYAKSTEAEKGQSENII